MKFKEGDRVGAGVDECGDLAKKLVYQGEYTDEPVYGKIVDVISATKVKVLFDDEYMNEATTIYNKTTGKPVKTTYVARTVDVKILLPEAECKKKFTELEKEYEAVAVQVRAKLKEAGALIKEANKLAKKAGAESLNDMYDALAPLEDAMDACGWRTSSWNC